MIPGESVATQHRFLVLYLSIKREGAREPRIRWWNWKGDKQVMFKEKIINETEWKLGEDANSM